MVAAAVALACSALTGLLLLPGTAAGVAQFELERPGKASAGLFTADGRLVRPLFSGRQLEAGAHTVEVDDSLLADAGSGYEIRVASSGAAVSYDWQGVIGAYLLQSAPHCQRLCHTLSAFPAAYAPRQHWPT